jgi:hypothetical protein
MKYLFILFFFILSIQGFTQTVINDKNAEVRNVSSFTGIKVSGGIDLYLSQSDNYSVAVSANEEKYRNNIKTEVKNGILVIWYDNDRKLNAGNKNLRAYVSFKDIESLEASGACDVDINGTLSANTMFLKLSGACEIKGTVKISNLTLELNGASTAKVDGTAQNLKLNASGASDVKNFDFSVENCVAEISGASDVRISVTNSISASASGASSFRYKGSPERKDIATSGASSINQKNN